MFSVWRRAAELPAWLKILLLGRFVSSAGSMAEFFMILYLVQERGLSPARAGLVVAAFGAAAITGNLVGGWFGDRFGLRRSVIAAQSVSALCVAAIPFAPVGGLVLLVSIGGVIGGTSRPLMSALVAVSLPTDRRRESIALWRTANNAGVLIGPPLGALISTHAFGALFLIDAASSLVMLAVVIARMPYDGRSLARATVRPPRLWPALRRDRTLITVLLTVTVVDTVYRLQYSVLPLHLADAGQPTIVYGTLIAINGGLIVLGEAALATALRTRRATSVIALGFALVGVGVFVFVGPASGWLGIGLAAAAMAVITGGEMLYKPTATAHAADSAPAGLEGRYQSLYGAASIMGTILTPAVGGWAYGHAPGAIWPVAAMLAVGAGWVLYRTPVKVVEVLPPNVKARQSRDLEILVRKSACFHAKTSRSRGGAAAVDGDGQLVEQNVGIVEVGPGDLKDLPAGGD